MSSPPLKEFISLCISPNPAARPTALQLLKHDFFECLRLGEPRLVTVMSPGALAAASWNAPV